MWSLVGAEEERRMGLEGLGRWNGEGALLD